MKKGYLYLLLFTLITAGIVACKKDKYAAPDSETALDSRHHDNDFKRKSFNQVNLVANNADYGATRVDPALVNAWGLAFSAGGVAWVGAQGGHASTVYNSQGGTVLGPVLIPSPGGPEGGNPTGVVLNPLATDFLITSGNGTPDAAGRFLFVGVDGVVSAWNPTWGTHAFSKYINTATSSYTGLTLANNAGSNYLYAADFKAGKIAVWDKTWAPVTTFPFKDWRLPKGYAPFNIQVVGTQLFVTYAKVGRDGRSQAGKGKGLVNIFTTDGKLVKRFAEEDKLNAPWGIAQVPASFFPQRMDPDDDDHSCDHIDAQSAILVGNFGDGHINIYSLKGKFLGQLKEGKHNPVEIDGLWAISLAPTTSTIDQRRLYFCAGPDKETDGLFGYVMQDTTVNVKHIGGHDNN